MIEFAASTGLRAGRVSGMRWSQVNMATRVMNLRMKAKRPVTIPFSDETYQTLERVPRVVGSDYIFVHTTGIHKGKRIKRFDGAFNAAIKRAKIETKPGSGRNFTVHDLRYTFITKHLDAGTPEAVIMRLADISTPSILKRYSHQAAEGLRESVNALDPLYKKVDVDMAAEAKKAVVLQLEEKLLDRALEDQEKRQAWNRISKAKLTVLVKEFPLKQIGVFYGITDSAVGKKCRVLGIKKPGRGYWARVHAGKISVGGL